MKMFIHSSYGVLDCQPMTLQAIEDSIPENPLPIIENENVNEPVNDEQEEAE